MFHIVLLENIIDLLHTKDGAFIKEYESVKEATKEMGLKHSSGIYLSCNHNNWYHGIFSDFFTYLKTIHLR